MMNFGKNLQKIRKAKGLSQEELAERMEVSRQAISKWESGAARPELEKVNELSEILYCSTDELLKGGFQEKKAVLSNDKASHERLMNKFARWISLAIALVLLGTSLLLGISALGMPYTDYGIVILIALVAVSAPIFVMRGIELGNFKMKHPKLEYFYTQTEIDGYDGKFAGLIAAGVSVIMLGLVVFLGLTVTNVFAAESPMPAAIFLLFVTVGAPMFVYAGIQKSKYDIAQYNKENTPRFRKNSDKLGRISGAIMMLATIVFLLLGFLCDGWKLAWLVFPVAGILCGIVATILQDNEEE